MINADFHTHTRYSTDSTAEPEDMLKEAIARGLKTYCFYRPYGLSVSDR